MCYVDNWGTKAPCECSDNCNCKGTQGEPIKPAAAGTPPKYDNKSIPKGYTGMGDHPKNLNRENSQSL